MPKTHTHSQACHFFFLHFFELKDLKCKFDPTENEQITEYEEHPFSALVNTLNSYYIMQNQEGMLTIERLFSDPFNEVQTTQRNRHLKTLEP